MLLGFHCMPEVFKGIHTWGNAPLGMDYPQYPQWLQQKAIQLMASSFNAIG